MNQRIQVLMIEDDPDYVLLMTTHLAEVSGASLNFVLESADKLKSGLDLLAQKDFDVVLLDLMLPDSQGLETLAKVRPHARGIPIVVMTNLDGEETGFDAVANGAQDFLNKGKLDPRLIKRTIGYAVERSYWISQLENIIGNCPDGMVIIDTAGIVRYINSAGEDIFGKKAGEMLGQPFGFPVQHKKTSELHVTDADGTEKVLDMRVTEVEWRRYKALLASVRDITELKKIEQMRAAIKEQRRLDELKEKFLNTVSHELRTPLTIVKAAVANLRDGLAGTMSEAQEQMVALTTRNVDRLTRIINNLLDISRLESGQAQVNSLPVDILKLVTETVQGVRITDREQKVTLELDLPAELPFALADPDMVTQVLLNLLDNAMRFAKSHVILRAQAVEPGEVQVSVIDDGPGIPADKVGDLFNKFVQVNRPAGGSGYKGTGLGLAICQESLKMNKGRIWVESALDQQTQFHFVLPQDLSGAPDREVQHAGSVKEKNPGR